RLGARLLLGPGLLPGGRLLGRGRLLGGRRGGRRGLRRRVLVALGLVLGEEVPPGGAHRRRVVEVLAVDLVDQPDVGPELRSFEPTHVRSTTLGPRSWSGPVCHRWRAARLRRPAGPRPPDGRGRWRCRRRGGRPRCWSRPGWPTTRRPAAPGRCQGPGRRPRRPRRGA